MTPEQEKAWDHRVSISHERVEHYDNDPQMQIVLQDDRAILAIDRERTALRKAVEWACENAPAGENAYVGAIRRKAKEG